MAEEFLEEVYIESDAYTTINCMIRDYRNGNSDSNFQTNINKYIQNFVKISKKLSGEGDIRGNELWEALVKLTKTNSLTICLDILEGDVLPRVAEYFKSLPKIDVDDEDGLILRSSNFAFLYQTDSKSLDRFDSAINPMQEAYEIARDFYNPSKFKYVFLGCGLGYIPYQMYKISEGEIDMTIFFHDQKSYEYAKLYGVLNWIPSENVNCVVSDDILSFLYKAKDGTDDIYIYKPDMRLYPANERPSLNEIIISQNTKFSTNRFVTKNFYRNTRRVKKYISDFDKKLVGDKFVVIAGGPSVDDNIEFIRNCKEYGYSTIAVGTVLKKLLAMNIRPDIVTACDPFVSVSLQFADIEDNKDVPFFLGLETDFRAARLYTGPKYLVPTGGISPQTYETIRDKVDIILQSTTTVTSFSYLIAAYLGAKEICLVGADYGFPNGLTHAKSTNDRTVVNDDLYGKVLSNTGEMIPASPQMILYREEMENLIKYHPDIITYNLSESGAKIEGAVLLKKDK